MLETWSSWVNLLSDSIGLSFSNLFNLFDLFDDFQKPQDRLVQAFPLRRRFNRTGCMASSRWLSTCTCGYWSIESWYRIIGLIIFESLDSANTLFSGKVALHTQLLTDSWLDPLDTLDPSDLLGHGWPWDAMGHGLLQGKLCCLNVIVAAKASQHFVHRAVQHLPPKDLCRDCPAVCYGHLSHLSQFTDSQKDLHIFSAQIYWIWMNEGRKEWMKEGGNEWIYIYYVYVITCTV